MTQPRLLHYIPQNNPMSKCGHQYEQYEDIEVSALSAQECKVCFRTDENGDVITQATNIEVASLNSYRCTVMYGSSSLVLNVRTKLERNRYSVQPFSRTGNDPYTCWCDMEKHHVTWNARWVPTSLHACEVSLQSVQLTASRYRLIVMVIYFTYFICYKVRIAQALGPMCHLMTQVLTAVQSAVEHRGHPMRTVRRAVHRTGLTVPTDAEGAVSMMRPQMALQCFGRGRTRAEQWHPREVLRSGAAEGIFG